MQTGQNSIAPENSLPQLGQVRWGSVIMALAALQPQPGPKATPRSTEWREIDQQGPWQTVVPFHKLVCSLYMLPVVIGTKNTRLTGIRRHDILNRTRIQKILGPPKDTP